ncbi:BQ5605_C004g02693 [Microbotryum silenes-dioicae]|uniref:BQ5605_C004g02693 protein n=1 Tax=Microbotryum silenes-dioicae TaxID=796604 RepID=A0A2X0M8K2_9BASI|nr:BQ5605_C004g02693 [Microbotryum silenes-dioicae]
MAAPSYPPAPQGSTRGPSKKAIKRAHAAPIATMTAKANQPPPLVRSGSKRPRPSESSYTATDVDAEQQPPAAAVRKVVGMKAVAAASRTRPSSITGDGSAFKRGMYLTFIDDAFKRRQQGQNERYKELIAQFLAIIPSTSSAPHASSSTSTSSFTSAETPTTASLRVWLDALTHIVSKLDATHAPLVETILAVPWATMDDGFVTIYVKFISALVSARPEWLQAVLSPCVQGFSYRSKYTVGSPAAMPSITRGILYSRLHAMLTMLLSLIPTLAPSLAPLLSIHFPAKREPKVAQICYIENLLVLSEYCSALTEDIMGLIVERALNIDVEIQGEPDDWEDAEEELLGVHPREDEANVKEVVGRLIAEDADASSDDEDEDDDGDAFNMEDLDSDDEPNPISDDEAAKKVRSSEGMSVEALRKILERRTKLDAILKVVLDHLANAHAEVPSSPRPPLTNEGLDSTETTPTPETRPSQEVVERRLALFRSLLDIFDRTLLRTFKTRNTQFILFYLCSLDVASSDQFIGVLLGRALFQTDAPAITRVAAAGYVASFISRATYVDASMTRKVVHHLCRYLETSMEDFAAASRVSTGPKASATSSVAIDLPVFYAVTQAVFYIFCFRWKDLMDEGEEDDLVLEPGRRWMLGLETIKKVVASNFNPLKVCAQSIVQQFATIANKTNFLYCWSLIDSNRRSGVRDANAPSAATSYAVPHLNRQAPPPPSRSSAASIPSAAPRQLLVAEEMDSFFPFDPFKMPLSSVYIDGIYREWIDDDASSSEASSDTSSSEASDSEDSASDCDPVSDTTSGWAVPGLLSTSSDPALDAEVARSFEAMSLSLSPHHESFGGRRKKEEDRRPAISSLA